MKKFLTAMVSVLLVLMLTLGSVAVAQDVGTDEGTSEKVDKLSAKAKTKFKGSVKAKIATKGKLQYGDEVTLKATVADAKKAEYSLQWQCRKKGSEWVDIEGETKKNYTFVITEDNAALEWRVALIAEAFVE